MKLCLCVGFSTRTNDSSTVIQKHVSGEQHIELSLQRSQKSRNILTSGRSTDIAFNIHRFMPAMAALNHYPVWFILDFQIIHNLLAYKIHNAWRNISLGAEDQAAQTLNTYSCWKMLWKILILLVGIVISKIWLTVFEISKINTLISQWRTQLTTRREQLLRVIPLISKQERR